ncbi:unnamed protein product [Rotaria sordida]|uniref:Uncharacterized protein n=1 Tax=Rotaria sordida TaxID=392033 RepID=A0A818VZI0_9BILA|nr:unnamed protein product [Rotaria sordida]
MSSNFAIFLLFLKWPIRRHPLTSTIFQISVKLEHHDQWINNSISFRQITQDISMLPTISTISKDNPSESNSIINKDSEMFTDEQGPREIKLYSAAQFRSHINRLYPFHMDFFTDKLSSLDFEQHRMGLYIFYDVNNGHLINDLEKESNKKTNRGKNMKRMNGLLLNEHRMFNQHAKEYATKHLTRDYEAIKPAIKQFMHTWLQRKTDLLLKQKNLLGQYYSQHMAIPLNSYDALTPVTLVNLSTVLRVGTIPLLTVPEKIEQMNIKCSDDYDRTVTNRFNSKHRLTNLVDDPNILAILSQHPSIDIVLSKSSFYLLIELFSTSPSLSPMTLPMSIREFQIETLDNPTTIPNKKKIIFIDKPLRQRIYTKRELNNKYFQRSFRSLLLSTTGGKRETTDNQFNYSSFNNKTEFQIIEMKNKTNENSLIKQTDEKQEENKNLTDDEDEDEDDEDAMIISTGGDIEQQQKLFNKSKQKIIHSAPTLQERETNNSDNTTDNNENGPVPVISRVKLATPIQGNYEYCLWQLGTLQILIRSSYHGFYRNILSDNKTNDELITCYSKLEYQPQFGLEQTTDNEYRLIWFESYLRHGASVLLGRINVFTQQLLKVEKMTYENIDQNLKECQIDMIKPITKTYGLLYGLQSLEPNNYLLSCPMNEINLYLYQTVPKESTEEIHDLHSEPFESNDLLIEPDHVSVPWIPLTPTLLLPYHLDFERIPLTFCPRNKRFYDIDITIPAYRKRRNIVKQEEKKNQDKKKRKKRNQENKRMDDYSTKIKISAEHLIRKEFPEKALELDKLVSSPVLSFSEVSKIRTEFQLPTADDIIAHLKNIKNTNSTDDYHNSTSVVNSNNSGSTKKHKIDSNNTMDSSESSTYEFNGTVPSNRLISILEDKLRPYILHFLDSVAIIKLWIQLMIPKVEDGNNFGVSIQEDSLAEVRTIETEVTQYIDLTCKYLISRGELIKKVVKYPHVEDYRRSVQSLDEKQFVSLRFIALELRNHYTSVHDLLMKNLEKIKTPRTNQIHSLY